jgi:hypothetical protein
VATKRKRRQWMIDDPNVPQWIGPRDLLVQLPGGDKLSVKSVFWAALHIAREERGVPLDIEQSGDVLLPWLETEFGGMLEFVRWFTLLCRRDQERVRSLALALDRPH